MALSHTFTNCWQRIIFDLHCAVIMPATILLATGDSYVLCTIREQKHLLHHRSHRRYHHSPQSARPVLAQHSPDARLMDSSDVCRRSRLMVEDLPPVLFSKRNQLLV